MSWTWSSSLLESIETVLKTRDRFRSVGLPFFPLSSLAPSLTNTRGISPLSVICRSLFLSSFFPIVWETQGELLELSFLQALTGQSLWRILEIWKGGIGNFKCISKQLCNTHIYDTVVFYNDLKPQLENQ